MSDALPKLGVCDQAGTAPGPNQERERHGQGKIDGANREKHREHYTWTDFYLSSILSAWSRGPFRFDVNET
jgi:hypothetical protein